MQREATDKRLTSKVHKQLMELIIKKTNKQENNQTMAGRPKQTSLQSRHTDGQNALKRCSTSLIIRDMQMKITMR